MKSIDISLAGEWRDVIITLYSESEIVTNFYKILLKCGKLLSYRSGNTRFKRKRGDPPWNGSSYSNYVQSSPK